MKSYVNTNNHPLRAEFWNDPYGNCTESVHIKPKCSSKQTELAKIKPAKISKAKIKTNLKYYDHTDMKVRNVYQGVSQFGGDTYTVYYIRRGNKYESIYDFETYDPEKMPTFTYSNSVKWLRCKIAQCQKRLDELRKRNQHEDNVRRDRLIGELDGLESILKYMLTAKRI